MTVRVAVILSRKGTDVATIRPGATVAEAARSLAERNVGALVVSSDGRTVEGILSERDIVRRLAESGGATVRVSVAEVMTSDVTTCEPHTTVDELIVTMTNRRIRHVPILEHGVLAGIVSIGDVVKSRMDELETQTESLSEYVTGSGY